MSKVSTRTILDNPINHITLIVDKSGSMANISKQTVKVFENLIKHLAKLSTEMNQETRVTCYLFGHEIEVLFYEKDVLRLPSLEQFYKADGQYTRLIDTTIQAMEDMEKIPNLYGSHSYLTYIITDGQDNKRSYSPEELSRRIAKCPDFYTFAIFVPDQHGVDEARRWGFPVENTQIWDTTSVKGVEAMATTINKATETYFVARSQGRRSVKNLFSFNQPIQTASVKQNLNKLDTSKFRVLHVTTEAPIKEFVSGRLGQYNIGTGYYQLTKRETVQAGKQICIREKATGDVYAGHEARVMLGLPTSEVRVIPADFGKWDLFVQSTSVNRKLVPGTDVVVLT